jgi:hypothetical protein
VQDENVRYLEKGIRYFFKSLGGQTWKEYLDERGHNHDEAEGS